MGVSFPWKFLSWTSENKHYSIDQKDEGTLDDRRRDGGTNFILRIKEQETRLTLHEQDDDDDDDDDDDELPRILNWSRNEK